MRVSLTTSIFADPVDTITLDVLAHLALNGWHRIVFEDEKSSPVQRWLGSLEKGHQEKWIEIIREGYFLESREPARYELCVTEQSGLTFTHGGGISTMPRTIEAWTAEGPHGHLRRWARLDSDALRPSERSDQSATLTPNCIMAAGPDQQPKR